MRLSKSILLVTVLLSAITPAYSAIVFEESASGDLSGSGSSPTVIALTAGSNQIFGSTGRDGNSVVDRDYFTINLPANLQLTSITLLPNSTSGNFSFIGIQAGNQVTLATNTTTASGLLGWWHYSPSDINTDLLSKSSAASNGSSGFSPPLGSGDYAFWVQDSSTGLFNYGLDITVSQVPLPGTVVLFLSGLGLIGLKKRQA